MPGPNWLDVTNISFNALLLLEPLHAEYLAEREPDEAMGIALKANPAIQYYFLKLYPPISDYINKCLDLAKPNSTPDELRAAEIKVLNSMHDWLIYILEPAKYDQLEFLGWDDNSLLGMADFKDKIVLDIGSGTGRLAFIIGPEAKVVYAIEPVGNLRRFIWKKRGMLDIDNVYPLDGSITQIPLPHNFADIVMAGHVFGEHFDEEYEEMRRVLKDSGMILLHPGTNALHDDEAHNYLVSKGFKFDTFEEPGDGLKRKYWKTIQK